MAIKDMQNAQKINLTLGSLLQLVNEVKASKTSALASVADGTTVAGKATADSQGNVIHTTYATKDEVNGFNTVKTAVETLVGDDANKSARTIANEELVKQLIPENAAEALDTLQEIAAWIQAHPNDASAMSGKIAALENAVGDSTKGLVKDAADLKETVGDSTKGLVKDLATLKADENTAGSVAKSIKDAIAGINNTVISDDNTLVSVKVVQNAAGIADVIVEDNAYECTSADIAALFADEV